MDPVLLPRDPMCSYGSSPDGERTQRRHVMEQAKTGRLVQLDDDRPLDRESMVGRELHEEFLGGELRS